MVYVILHVAFNLWASAGVEISIGETKLGSFLMMGLDFPLLAFVIFYCPCASAQMEEAYIGEYLGFFFKIILVIILHLALWFAGMGLAYVFFSVAEVFPILGIILASIISIGVVVLTIRFDNMLTQGALVELYSSLKFWV